ncbi:aminotransferase class I/II-fold pyridoxal phosphate-dependent enzyme [Thalassorhabdus alkalitolerans]|uniref:Aminotransferase class I/II-fold pyridoxal phosphate-dependent enzyme n=1 Tax=Thalassorhabdus alkalitolerans TaxID=2282697 RepID=A0ABW0YLG2_9BACI
MTSHYSDKIKKLAELAEEKIGKQHKEVEKIEEYNQGRLLTIYKEEGVSAFHFNPSTGYGYDDAGRETLDKVYARAFGTEDALVRHQFISGTHAIATALFGSLRPGEELVYITGTPYDTLQQVIGLTENEPGSLKDYGIACSIVPLTKEGNVDYPAVSKAITKKTKVVAIQRSRGYDTRPSFAIEEIKNMTHFVKEVNPEVIVFVDNCYGEFVEETEPGHVGVDLMAGSLIKNPGGGLAKTGGYIAGRKRLVDQAAGRLSAPGIGREGGATLSMLLEMYQGFFMAPHTVAQSLKGAFFTAALLEEAGLTTTPSSQEKRTDLIQAIQFEDKERMISFCQAIQEASPVDAKVVPMPSPMPGYEDEVIMAAGTFIQGASIELSADGPIRPPYTAFVQGGLTYIHVKTAVMRALDELIKKNMV